MEIDTKPLAEEKLIYQVNNVLDHFIASSVDSVNFKPHPYCITPQHLQYANMYLDKGTIKDAEKHGVKCGMYHDPSNPSKYCNYHKKGFVRCSLSYEQHTNDKALFLKLKCHLSKKEAGKELLKIKPLLDQNNIDGIAFLETAEKFRID